jgi:molybdopterin-guanine dinucleotide biosynthesis protein A
MGQNKAIMFLGKKRLIQIITSMFQEVVEKVIVVIGYNDDPNLITDFLPKNVEVVKDLMPIQSPLVGLMTGMKSIDTNYALVSPCDTPFINQNVIKSLIEKIDTSDAVIPKWQDGRIEPLLSIYRVELAQKYSIISINKGEKRVDSILKYFKKINYVSADELGELKDKEIWFFNLNTPTDYKKAHAILDDLN